MKVKAIAALLELKLSCPLHFGRQKFDAKRSDSRGEFQFNLTGGAGDGLFILDAAAPIIFVGWRFAVVIHEVQCDLISNCRT